MIQFTLKSPSRCRCHKLYLLPCVCSPALSLFLCIIVTWKNDDTVYLTRFDPTLLKELTHLLFYQEVKFGKESRFDHNSTFITNSIEFLITSSEYWKYVPRYPKNRAHWKNKKNKPFLSIIWQTRFQWFIFTAIKWYFLYFRCWCCDVPERSGRIYYKTKASLLWVKHLIIMPMWLHR